jgi:H+-transporting ATPase
MLLAVGLLTAGQAVLTPMLMVIVMVTGNFFAMSLAADNVTPLQTQNLWQIGKITAARVFFGVSLLLFCTFTMVIASMFCTSISRGYALSW